MCETAGTSEPLTHRVVDNCVGRHNAGLVKPPPNQQQHSSDVEHLRRRVEVLLHQDQVSQ